MTDGVQAPSTCQTGKRRKKKAIFGWASIVDSLPGDERNILISASIFLPNPLNLSSRANFYLETFDRYVQRLESGI